MKFLLPIWLSLALVATSFGQTAQQVANAVSAVTYPEAGPIPPAAAVSYGIIDRNGTVMVNAKTGTLALAAGTTIGGSAVVALGTITSSSATAFSVGLNGATNPAFNIDASTASSATGINIKSAAAAAGVAVKVLSSGTDENLTLDAKGAGTVLINGTATGSVRIGTGLLSKQLTEVVAATNVIAATESGSVFFLNSATEFVSTLPAPAAGLHFTFIVTAAPSGASYTVVTTTSANIIKGNQNSVAGDAGDFGTADDTITFVDGQSVAGDKVEVYCDGTNWFAYGISKVAAGLTFTQATP